jgi:chromosome segregation ATPase
MIKKLQQPNDEAPSLAEDIDTAARLLGHLEAEKAELPNKIREASNELDSIEMVNLRRRFDEIDIHIYAARVRVEGLKIRADEAMLIEAEMEVARLVEPVELTKARLDEAQAAFNAASYALRDAQTEVRNVWFSIAEHRRRLQALNAEANKPLAPVVRSRIHQVA